ncbi:MULTISPECIES: bifunctional phosphopantothenoylcysteine decarboxylase/phosphopantothenate--cysteine ligase CoaBC [Thermoanaerobacterium]|uniref:Coenzyme A biosynthesis bifunctional protein CoaBC n=2 Tax=Thermoanaerobacterium TaxID=28895 RepID=W9E9A6_9THEO|nr:MULTISPECIES: bifunctional phosphopantothenoylcysteine decarboxylase/phosphopantothenate--cysteine ligase CoaBC [Thermoanaerobacterium]AFK86723.1 phosphopantothenoylcysteine decarboxylase/phosphopantothenate/cysteine ligase [Thermoanaerobacterium saccharolyticum JW/SL-YS485]ETO38518.1 phosphopantothenoylcysteine decarboxylase/phosphopantothenate--cysteine ligase [Thermoanaerobacterium aotearoense SCUT27]
MDYTKNVVIGVTGGIAAYKSADLVSRLVKKNINVDVIMTESATKFISPLTFESLSHNKVVVDMFDSPKFWEIEHIALAEKADVFAIVPATANIIGKIANGIADDMLTTTIMATDAKIVIAPAMNTNMYQNMLFQENLKKLKSIGYSIIEPEEGRLACGTFGKGKLAKIEDIEKKILELLGTEKNDYDGITVLVTAGPTVEPIDPVRYITNRSSGKMGFEIAKAAKSRGAKVILISGPTSIEDPVDVETIHVNTALEMYNVVMKFKGKVDVFIGAAAVADYRPAIYEVNKIKKSDDALVLKLVRNPDILYEFGKEKGNTFLVGFAAETENLIESAKAKIIRKNLDLIVANDVLKEGAGFSGDTNIVNIIDKNMNVKEYPLMSKTDVAHVILDEIKNLFIR